MSSRIRDYTYIHRTSMSNQSSIRVTLFAVALLCLSLSATSASNSDQERAVCALGATRSKDSSPPLRQNSLAQLPCFTLKGSNQGDAAPLPKMCANRFPLALKKIPRDVELNSAGVCIQTPPMSIRFVKISRAHGGEVTFGPDGVWSLSLFALPAPSCACGRVGQCGAR